MAQQHPSVQSVLLSGTITDAQTLELRRQFYADGKIGSDEAAWLFELNSACSQQGHAWGIFFVEAITDFIVNQSDPRGFVSEDNAAWLVQQIDKDGRLDTVNELELLLHIFEQVRSVPETLSAYALDQVRQTILAGQGVTRRGPSLEPGLVTESDVEILRRILYAYGSGGNIGITAAEAEVLFDINDATAQAQNHPAWNVLFAQAIANHLMMAAMHKPLSREAALRQEEWLIAPSRDPETFIDSLAKSLRSIYVRPGAKGQSSSKSSGATFGKSQVDETADSEAITAFEAQWLVDRINRDGVLSQAERAVLTFIARESRSIHPALKPLLDKVA